MQDGSAGDPASIGVSVILANWTGQDDQDYAGAARDQLDFLLNHVPKTDDGAISHRVSEAQLWSDSVYMVRPRCIPLMVAKLTPNSCRCPRSSLTMAS